MRVALVADLKYENFSDRCARTVWSFLYQKDVDKEMKAILQNGTKGHS